MFRRYYAEMAEIERLTKADQKIADQMDALIKQLDAEKSCSLHTLQAVLDSPTVELWVAREGERIVGMVTLTISQRIGGKSARIEDVVVQEAYRGKGLGKLLCQNVIKRAKASGVYSLQLTSRRERKVANKLYQKLGFELRDTNSYRLQL